MTTTKEKGKISESGVSEVEEAKERKDGVNIYLLCDEDGNILDVIKGKSFEEVYDRTVALNNGYMLVEMDKNAYLHVKEMIEELEKEIDDELLISVCEAEDYERDGKIVVNNIGITTYVSFDDLTADELMAVAELKRRIEE